MHIDHPSGGSGSREILRVPRGCAWWQVLSGLALCLPAALALAAGPTPGEPASSAPAAIAPMPFDEVVQGATRQDGLLPIWRKDEKVWFEIGPALLGRRLLISVNIASSVGERSLYASQMGPAWMGEFRRVGTQVQLIARNTAFRAEGDPARQFTVGEGFSDSLLGSSAVLSLPHPARHSVLIDAGFLLGDVAGYSTQLEESFRLPFAPDRVNSTFELTHAQPGLTTLRARVHYSVPRIPAVPLAVPGVPAPPYVAPPTVTPDPRSLFVGFVYNFRDLPQQAMAARRADPRVGFFTQSFTDLSDDLRPNRIVHHITRWRLEKRDPMASLSEPVQPITYWLDRTIPQRYRRSVEAGILEWNKAFERIGYKNAIVVRQQADDAGFDTLDAGHASVRWFAGADADANFAIGPAHSDPRSGEILDADIAMSDIFSADARRLVDEEIAPRPAHASAALFGRARRGAYCSYGHEAAIELGFALDLLSARGELGTDSPEADALAQAAVKAVVMHEVGHTLGLRHNFKASAAMTALHLVGRARDAQAQPSASVMDYNPFNLPLSGEPRGRLAMSTIGVYDYWAIEFAYSAFEPGREADELERIAMRSATEPELAFGDDADAGEYPVEDGIDPLANRYDLGDDPLAWAQRRTALARELWTRLQARGAHPGDDPLRLRRSLLSGFRQLARMPTIAAKYVGGMYTTHDLPGTTRRLAYRPVEPQRQRAALRFLAESIFSVDSFRFRPEFLASLGSDYVAWDRPGLPSVPQAVLQMQGFAMNLLMSARTARRLLEMPNYLPADQRRGAISLGEVYGALQTAVWSELDGAREIDPMRRNLQREHLRRLQSLLTSPAPDLPADSISLARLHAVKLQSALRRAGASPRLSLQSRAHLQESLSLLTQALQAPMQRGLPPRPEAI